MTTQNKSVPALRFPEFVEDWKEAKLGNVFEIFNGYAFSSNDSQESGTLWVKIADVGIQEMKTDNLSYLPFEFLEKHKKFILKKGDFVLALTRPILNGKLKIAKINDIFNNSLLNQRVGKLISKNDLSFVYYFLQQKTLIKTIENNIAGTDPPNLSPTSINTIETRIPENNEQQKIAAFLTVVDEKIQQLAKKKDLLEQYKKGVMEKIFNKEIRFKDENGNDFADWEEKKLGDFTFSSAFGPRFSSNLYSKSGNVLTLRTTDMNDDGVINYDSAPLADIDVKQLKEHIMQENDLIISRSGTIGITGIFQGYKIPVIPGAFLIRFRVNTNKVSPAFIKLLFNSAKGRNKIESLSAGGVQKNLTSTSVLNMSIDFPSLPEQQKIADFLSSIDEKINSVNQQLEKTKEYKKGLLQQMFI
jgi:type I restriction enzyme S subunit